MTSEVDPERSPRTRIVPRRSRELRPPTASRVPDTPRALTGRGGRRRDNDLTATRVWFQLRRSSCLPTAARTATCSRWAWSCSRYSTTAGRWYRRTTAARRTWNNWTWWVRARTVCPWRLIRSRATSSRSVDRETRRVGLPWCFPRFARLCVRVATL